jgi:Zn-dependent peptidase ImmA (M78 family)
MAKTLEQALSDRRRVLANQYAYIAEIEEIAELKACRLQSENPYAYEDEVQRLARPISRFDGIAVEPEARTTGSPKRKRRTEREIRELARDMQIQIWEKRAELFPDYLSMTPADMLDPVAALSLLGFQVDFVGALGQLPSVGRQLSAVAGIIDKAKRQVLLSTGLPPAVSNFTAAHELGHALMHDFAGMHRDKPLDGSSSNGDWQEQEAERFAVYFLMPEKLLRKRFEQTFGAAPFVLDENTRFALSSMLPSENWHPRNLRDLSRILASVERFNGFNILSLMKQFRVSREAMAIRLEQLDLVALAH